jgi:chromosome partitioning protein
MQGVIQTVVVCRLLNSTRIIVLSGSRKCGNAGMAGGGVAVKLSFLNQKGGAGKTTLAVHVAAVLAATGAKVLLLDADSQGSALDWSVARQKAPAFTVVGLPKPTVHKELPRLSQDYDHVVIDGPPRVAEITRSVIMASDLIAIPVQPSPYDVWAVKDVVELIKEARVYKELLKAVFVINRKIVNTAIGRDVVEALATYELGVLPTAVCQRVAFAESAARGSTVIEDAPTSIGAEEIRNLVKELTRLFNEQEGRDYSEARTRKAAIGGRMGQ